MEYHLNDVSFTFCGVPFTGGYGEGGAIKIAFNAELYENVIGVSGDVVRSTNNDKSANIEVTLLQTSEYNKTLKTLQSLQSVGPLLIRDRRNGDELVAQRAWVQKRPDYEFGQKSVDRVWTIKAERLEEYPGGR